MANSIEAMHNVRNSFQLREDLRKKFGAAYIYDIKGKQARRWQRYTKGVVTLVLARDHSGEGARTVKGVYSRHKKQWMECVFDDKRLPNKRILDVVIGIALF